MTMACLSGKGHGKNKQEKETSKIFDSQTESKDGLLRTGQCYWFLSRSASEVGCKLDS